MMVVDKLFGHIKVNFCRIFAKRLSNSISFPRKLLLSNAEGLNLTKRLKGLKHRFGMMMVDKLFG